MGIRDGLDFGKEETLQQGFDEGFALGARRAFDHGLLRGWLSTARACGLLASDDDDAAVDACIQRLYRQSTRVPNELLAADDSDGAKDPEQAQERERADEADVRRDAMRLLAQTGLSAEPVASKLSSHDTSG